MRYHNLIKIGEKFLEEKNISRPKYESILLFSKVNKINFNDYYVKKKTKNFKNPNKNFFKKDCSERNG